MPAGAWRQLRRNWQLPVTPALLTQSWIAGSLMSLLGALQSAVSAKARHSASLSGSIFILGYWRSGTTLLHDYLCHDQQFGFPSTYACMHPQHFILTQSAALQRPAATVRRPMDDILISPSSPQEDEFGLLASGARSPYEALLAPSHLAEALALADPRDLPAEEQRRWRDIFEDFLRGVCVAEGGRPLILKSPPHGYRVTTLRELIPDARFILIVRSPSIVYESTVRMWRTLFPLYALEAIPPEDNVRRIVLEDRPRFEMKLSEGLSGFPEDRIALVRYEDLVRDPVDVIARLYEKLQLSGFADVERRIRNALQLRSPYVARNAVPSEYWQRQVQAQWRGIFAKYRYELDPCG
jgi:hypothetical protein